MFVLLIVVLALIIVYVLTLQGRTGHPGLDNLRQWNYAHRGLHSAGVPENSMEAFAKALDCGYGVEFDVHLLSDGNLAVIHDYSLLRTAGVDVLVEGLTAQQLGEYRLSENGEPIPTFSQVLNLFNGKAPLIIELKTTADNYAALCVAVCKELEGYKGDYCIESFDPRCIYWLKKNHPDLIRGQLAENFFRSKTCTLSFLLKASMTWLLGNFLSKPDFIAYKFCDRKNLSVFLFQKIWRVQGIAWTLKTPKEHEIALKEGWIPIFEDYRP